MDAVVMKENGRKPIWPLMRGTARNGSNRGNLLGTTEFATWRLETRLKSPPSNSPLRSAFVDPG